MPFQLPLLIVGTALLTTSLVTGIALALTASGRGKTSGEGDLASHTELRLHCYGDARLPTRLSSDNIWRWYMLSIIGKTVPEGDAPSKIFSLHQTLFVTFDKPVNTTTLEVSSPDMTVPLFEVKEFVTRFAIVVFSEALPSGTLVVSIKP